MAGLGYIFSGPIVLWLRGQRDRNCRGRLQTLPSNFFEDFGLLNMGGK